jgi:hypothetical protein
VDFATTALTVRFKRGEANRGGIEGWARDLNFYLHASEMNRKAGQYYSTDTC